jgi:predicted  nucleic acid-binding Zn-ribbon protein
MHIFEYMCSSCLKDFDVLELPGRISSMAGCPHCGGRDLTFKFDRFEALGKKREPAPGDEPDDKDEESDEGEEEDAGELEDDEDGEDLHSPAEFN